MELFYTIVMKNKGNVNKNKGNLSWNCFILLWWKIKEMLRKIKEIYLGIVLYKCDKIKFMQS